MERGTDNFQKVIKDFITLKETKEKINVFYSNSHLTFPTEQYKNLSALYEICVFMKKSTNNILCLLIKSVNGVAGRTYADF